MATRRTSPAPIQQSDAGFQALIDAMDVAQLRLCAMLRPGVDYRDVHLQAHREVAAMLSESGLVRSSTADSVFEQGITRTFFPHGVGHYIGLQVHDVGGFLGGHGWQPVAETRRPSRI